MKLNPQLMPDLSDETLWQRSRDGDREAFGRIVERYQSLICALAYSACGNLANSEDLAQETFLTAWRRLEELREPGKLRAWLCGIVRNLSANAVRREARRGGSPSPLDAAAEFPSPEVDPAVRAVTCEEERLLWQTLAGMPESYREPLVLFYREQQSISEVAKQLELSEDTVKQRLSRGRAMLRAEMTGIVESALSRSRPGAAFKVAVLAALPTVSGSMVSAALAAGGTAGSNVGAAGKGLLAKFGGGALIGPAIGLLCAYFGTKAAASTARSTRERQCVLRYARRLTAFCFVLSIGLVAVLSQAGKLFSASAVGILIGVCAWTTALVCGVWLICRRMEREVQRIRIETRTTDEDYRQALAAQGKVLQFPTFFESKARFLGLPLFAIAWGGTSSAQPRSRAVCGWLAMGDIAVSPLLAIGGVAVGPVAIGPISVGVFSLSWWLWGVAVGVFAMGSLAIGWSAVGGAAAGVKCAIGLAAVARDYAIGLAASAAEAGTAAAKGYIKSQWLTECLTVIADHPHWWLLGCVVVALALGRRRKLPQAENAQGNAD
ncbi:MAG TPA: sigma-70 family RNA polymerase sigma factor [Methylomirabilota bacterium]|nr:sigma-70 family RNA polymerase sigma factor [Methylomirabilota bacterium]